MLARENASAEIALVNALRYEPPDPFVYDGVKSWSRLAAEVAIQCDLSREEVLDWLLLLGAAKASDEKGQLLSS